MPLFRKLFRCPAQVGGSEGIQLQLAYCAAQNGDMSVLSVDIPVYRQLVRDASQSVPHNKSFFRASYVVFCRASRASENAVRKTCKTNDLCIQSINGRDISRRQVVPEKRLLFRHDYYRPSSPCKGFFYFFKQILGFFRTVSAEDKLSHRIFRPFLQIQTILYYAQ